MKKTAVLSLVVVLTLFAVAVAPEAQQPTKIPRIGFLFNLSHADHASHLDAFWGDLRKLPLTSNRRFRSPSSLMRAR